MTLRHRILTEERLKLLPNLLEQGKILKFIEAHNCLSALVGNNAMIEDGEQPIRAFDGLWISSLTHSAVKGHPDAEIIGIDSRLRSVQEIIQLTNKPIIVDGDTGGDAIQFEYFCSKLENMGGSATVIEDKVFPKRNSLEKGTIQILDDPYNFASKINRAKKVCLTKDFLIFARIESLISGYGVEDALMRASIYLESLADGILIHSIAKTAEEIYRFLEGYDQLCLQKGIRKPIICVPTAYASTPEEDLEKHGINVVIYANQLLRAAHKAMKETCNVILRNHRSSEVTPLISTVKDIFEEVGFMDLKAKDALHHEKADRIILFEEHTKKNKNILEYKIHQKSFIEMQLEEVHKANAMDVTYILNKHAKPLELPAQGTQETKFIMNNYPKSMHSIHKLFESSEDIKEGFIAISGNIFFNSKIIKKLSAIDATIVTVIDGSRHSKNKGAVYVKSREVAKSLLKLYKSLEVAQFVDGGEKATHEFVGITKFSAEGAKLMCEIYHSLYNRAKEEDWLDDFYNLAAHDLLNECLKRGHTVTAYEIFDGWMKINSLNDVTMAEKLLKSG